MRRFKAIGEVDLDGIGRVTVEAGRYQHGGHIAIVLTDNLTRERIATLSTNLAPGGVKLPDDSFTVKGWSENAELIAPMLASGLFRQTDRLIATGFVWSPVWRIANPEHIPSPERSRGRER